MTPKPGAPQRGLVDAEAVGGAGAHVGTSALRLGWAVTRTATTVERGFTIGVERHKVSPVAVGTLIAVRLRDGGPLQLQALAEEAGVTRANVSAELARLQADGLIVRQRDPDDARRIRARVTPEGALQLGRWIELGASAVDGTLSALDSRQRQRLYELSGRLADDSTDPAIAEERLQQVEGLFPHLDLSPLTAGLALGRAATAIRTRVDRGLASSELTPRHLHALILVTDIDGEPLHLATLAPQLGLNRASVGRTLRELEQRHLLQRQGDHDDRRRIRATLTSTGRRQFHDLMPVLSESYEAALSPLSGAHRAELARILHRIDAAPWSEQRSQ